jgi:hypothetical protein
MEKQSIIFTVNIALIIFDASVGYFIAPVLTRLAQDETSDQQMATKTIRRMLSGVVTVYMFLNCLAYFRGEELFLLIVSALVGFDIILLLYFRNKLRSGGSHP